jgi:hypothetical protein
VGGTGLEPVTPSLSSWCGRSRPFAQVRSDRIVERKPQSERTLQRTRTNADRCHCCHAQRAGSSAPGLGVEVRGSRGELRARSAPLLALLAALMACAAHRSLPLGASRAHCSRNRSHRGVVTLDSVVCTSSENLAVTFVLRLTPVAPFGGIVSAPRDWSCRP